MRLAGSDGDAYGGTAMSSLANALRSIGSLRARCLAPLFMGLAVAALPALADTYSTPGTYTWTAPAGVTTALIEAWGAGGAGGGATGFSSAGGGGSGGQYSYKSATVVPGRSYTVVVGAGGTGGTGNGTAGGDSKVSSAADGNVVVAKGGTGGAAATADYGQGAGGVCCATGSVGTAYAGGAGSSGSIGWFSSNSGAGGGGAGSGGAGGDASGSTGGVGTAVGGGNGADGRTNGGSGSDGSVAGGGAAGGYASGNTDRSGGDGAAGQVVITPAPSVTTNAATGLAGGTATLNGTISSNGSTTATYFQYGLTNSYGTTVAGSPASLSAAASNSTVSASLTGLKCDTTYHYRAYAINSGGSSYGADATFTTGTNCAVSLTKTSSSPSATLNSSVSFTITATNPNPKTALSNIVVTDTLPASMTYGSHAVTLGSATRSGQSLTWTLPTLMPGASAQMTVVVTATATGTYTNTASSAGALDASAKVTVVSGAYVHYKMEEAINSWKGTTGEVKDSGTNGLNGTLVSSALNNHDPISPSPTIPAQQPTVAGGFCNAGTFDGSTVIQAPYSSFFQFSTTFSASAWIYPTAYPSGSGSNDLYTVLSNDTNYEFHIDPNRHLYWWWQLGGVDKTLTSAATVPLNQWTHVAITFDSTNASAAQRIYINGVLDTNTSALKGTLTSNACNFYIGGDIYTRFDIFGTKQCTYSSVGATGRSFKGMLDEVKIYNYALTSDQVQADMKLGRLCSGSYDHVRIEHDGKASVCMAEPVTVKACMDSNCASLYTGSSVSVSLSPSATAWTPNPVTLTKGIATAKLSNTALTGATITLGGTIDSNPAPNNTTVRCFDVSSGTPVEGCTLTVDQTPCSSNFDAAEPSATAAGGAAPARNLYTKLAGQPFSVDVVALADTSTINAAYNGSVSVDLVDACPSGTAVCTVASTGSTTQTVVFPSDESAKGRMTTANFVCPNAMTSAYVRLKPGSATNYACGTDVFSVRPTAVQISATDANAGALVPSLFKAGETPFSLTTVVGTYDLNAASPTVSSVSGYTGTLKVGTIDVGGMGTPPTVKGVAVPWTAGSMSSATLAVGLNAGLTYSEVGLFKLLGYWPSSGSTTRDDTTARGIYDDTWTSLDNAQGDCIAGSYSNMLVGNKYGCNFGLVTEQSFGRFIPHHFQTAATGGMDCPSGISCSAGVKTVYSRQPFTAEVAAYAKSGASSTLTKNFMGSYARDVALSARTEKDASNGWSDSAVTGGALTPATVSATAFVNGVATTNSAVSGVVMTSPAFAFTKSTTAPTNVVLRASETETSGTPPSVSVAVSSLQTPANSSVEGEVKVIGGRLKISNTTIGSEKTGLTVPVQAQYWTGQAWVQNDKDTTALTASAVYLSKPAAGTSVADKFDTASITLNATGAGKWDLFLPAPNMAGSVDLTIDLGASGTDYTSCLSLHGGTPAGAAWLRGKNGTCSQAAAETADPTGRATFGVYTPENRRNVHVRELF